MHQSKLEKLYDKATPEKLVGIFRKANHFENQAVQLKKKSKAIEVNVLSAIERRLEKFGDDDEEHLASNQLNEMSKQWSIMAASIVRVKNSVKLDHFHSRLNLYISPKYGIKEYKRFVRYIPFSGHRFTESEKKMYKYQENKLMIMKHSWDEGFLDFRILWKVPQLHRDKIHKFIEITKDIVYMIDSWHNFHRVKNNPLLKTFEYLKKYSYSYMSRDNNEFKAHLSKLDKCIAFKKSFSINAAKQAARWELTVNKWKEINKNFLVFNELRNSKLKI